MLFRSICSFVSQSRYLANAVNSTTQRIKEQNDQIIKNVQIGNLAEKDRVKAQADADKEAFAKRQGVTKEQIDAYNAARDEEARQDLQRIKDTETKKQQAIDEANNRKTEQAAKQAKNEAKRQQTAANNFLDTLQRQNQDELAAIDAQEQQKLEKLQSFRDNETITQQQYEDAKTQIALDADAKRNELLEKQTRDRMKQQNSADSFIEQLRAQNEGELAEIDRQNEIKMQKLQDFYDRDTLALVLKIVINSVYGKLGFENGNLYDRLAVLKTTINGQLMMLMLVEELELHNIHVLSANTDGIVIKLYKRDIDIYNSIKDNWEQTTKLKFDTDYYHCLVSRDINNYLSQFRVIKNGVHKLKLESKGALNPMMYSLDLTKGYSMPIVAQAIENYFLKNKPVMDTLQEATNILDFCLTQNVGRQFHVEETKIENGQVTHVVCQRYVRFYVSNRGYIIEKVHNDNGSRSRMAAGSVVTVINSLDDKDISLRDINFKFYYQEAMKVINPIKLNRFIE